MNCTAVKRFIAEQCKALPAMVIGGSLVGYIGAHVVNILNFDTHLAAAVPLAAAPAFASFAIVAHAVTTIVYGSKLPFRNERELIKDIFILIPSVTVMFGVYATLNGLTGSQLLLIDGAMLV